MCRHLAYLGEPVTLATLVIDPEQSLRRQVTAPRFQHDGRHNRDGFGVGWYESTDAAEPLRYRTTRSLDADDRFAREARQARATVLLAAVRSATPGSAIDERGNAPFADGPWLFSLNGAVGGFRDGLERELRSRVTPGRAQGIEGDTDSETLFALTLDRLDAGATAAEALADVDATLGALTAGPPATLRRIGVPGLAFADKAAAAQHARRSGKARRRGR